MRLAVMIFGLVVIAWFTTIGVLGVTGIAADSFNLPRYRTIIMGSHIDV